MQVQIVNHMRESEGNKKIPSSLSNTAGMKSQVAHSGAIWLQTSPFISEQSIPNYAGHVHRRQSYVALIKPRFGAT